jgi:hypothetical protein
MRTVPVHLRRRRRVSLGSLLSVLAGVAWAWGAVSHAMGPETARLCSDGSGAARTAPPGRLHTGFCDVLTHAPITVDLTDFYSPSDRVPVSAAPGRFLLSTSLSARKFELGTKEAARQ